jgi:hypothetical protein
METGEIFDKNYREKDTYNSDFWVPILQSPSFNKFIEDKYRVGHGAIMQDEDDISAYEDLDEDA